MTKPERFPAVNMSLKYIDQATEGLTGIGLTLNALLIGGDYETPEDRLIDNMRLVGGLYSCIEVLAWAVSMDLESIINFISIVMVDFVWILRILLRDLRTNYLR